MLFMWHDVYGIFYKSTLAILTYAMLLYLVTSFVMIT